MPHIHEKFDFVISAFIAFNGRALLVNHPRYNMWIPVGGHIELDEDPEQALLREIKEETGITDVKILSSKPQVPDATTKFIFTPNYIDVHYANPPHKHIAFIYLVKVKSDEVVKSAEHDELKWFTPEELEETKYKLSPEVKFYANEAIRLNS